MTLGRLLDKFRAWLIKDTLEEFAQQRIKEAELLKELSDKLRVLAACIDRMDTLERAFVSQEQAHNEAIRELQERLELPKRSKPSGRPFSVLQKIAEAGERAKAQK